MSAAALEAAQRIARAVVDDLGGAGIFGVELSCAATRCGQRVCRARTTPGSSPSFRRPVRVSHSMHAQSWPADSGDPAARAPLVRDPARRRVGRHRFHAVEQALIEPDTQAAPVRPSRRARQAAHGRRAGTWAGCGNGARQGTTPPPSHRPRRPSCADQRSPAGAPRPATGSCRRPVRSREESLVSASGRVFAGLVDRLAARPCRGEPARPGARPGGPARRRLPAGRIELRAARDGLHRALGDTAERGDALGHLVDVAARSPATWSNNSVQGDEIRALHVPVSCLPAAASSIASASGIQDADNFHTGLAERSMRELCIRLLPGSGVILMRSILTGTPSALQTGPANGRHRPTGWRSIQRLTYP